MRDDRFKHPAHANQTIVFTRFRNIFRRSPNCAKLIALAKCGCGRWGNTQFTSNEVQVLWGKVMRRNAFVLLQSDLITIRRRLHSHSIFSICFLMPIANDCSRSSTPSKAQHNFFSNHFFSADLLFTIRLNNNKNWVNNNSGNYSNTIISIYFLLLPHTRAHTVWHNRFVQTSNNQMARSIRIHSDSFTGTGSHRITRHLHNILCNGLPIAAMDCWYWAIMNERKRDRETIQTLILVECEIATVYGEQIPVKVAMRRIFSEITVCWPTSFRFNCSLHAN